MTPIPAGETRREISEKLLQDLDTRARNTKIEGRSIWERFGEEHPLMLPVPGCPFSIRRTHLVSVDKTSVAQVEGVRYSLPTSWARLNITAHVGVEDVEFASRGLRLVRQRGRKGERVILYRDYLGELAKKPQAVRQVAPELMAELGEPFVQLWSMLMDTHGPREGSRVMAKILQAVVDHNQDAVASGIWKALRTRRLDLLSIGCRATARKRLISVPSALSQYEVESARAADFNFLMMGASA